MSKISAVVIAKNAEELIADCLDSLSFCDEVIVIDAGSDDRTAEIAEKMGAKVFRHESKDFSDLRNFGLQKAKGEWTLYIDTDERVSEKLKEEIRDLIINSGRSKQLNIYRIRRKNFYLGNHEWPYVEKIERLFKKSHLRGWKGELHESPIVDSDLIGVDGKVGELDGFLFHYTHRDLKLMLEKTIEWSKIEAQLRFRSGHPKMNWWRFPRVMIFAFLESYIRQGGWKLGVIGLIESLYQSFSMFITYARLWEMQHEKEQI